MAFSARSVFLSVYTSNSIIKAVFLPVCSLVFFSPLLLLLARALKLNCSPSFLLPEGWRAPDILPQIFLSLVAVLLSTRIISGRGSGRVNEDGRTRRVPLIPYWVPGLRHWMQFIWDEEGFLNNARDSSVQDIFAYDLAGTKHNVILSPSLLKEILLQNGAVAESVTETWIIPHNALGMPTSARAQYQMRQAAVSEAIRVGFYNMPKLAKILSSSTKALEDSLPDLITFNPSLVDQMPWERVSGLELTEGTVEAEVDLFALLNEFICNSILPSITGPQFPESYQLLASDLMTLNQSFFLLATGLPRWFPIPGLPGAYLARRRLLENLTKYFNDLSNPAVKKKVSPLSNDQETDSDSGFDSPTDAEAPTPLSKLNECFMEHDLPLPARASIALDLLHGLASEAVSLSFWTLIHIISSNTLLSTSDSSLLAQLHSETEMWAHATQPPSVHPLFPSPPQIMLSASLKDLLEGVKSPTLNSCIQETQRLYGTPLDSKILTRDIAITEKDDALAGENNASASTWALGQNEVVDVGLSFQLQNTSPANYVDAKRWKANRFLHSASPTTSTGSPLDELTRSFVAVLIAGMIQLWDVSPKEGKGASIEIPGSKPGGNLAWPRRDIRVRIRRRELTGKI